MAHVRGGACALHQGGRCWSPFSGVRLRIRTRDPRMDRTAFVVDQSLGSVADPHRREQANVESNAEEEGLNTDDCVIWHINVHAAQHERRTATLQVASKKGTLKLRAK